MNKVIGIVITDGVGYRNFVMSNFLEEVCKHFKKVIIYSGLPCKSYDFDLVPTSIKIEELHVFTESKLTWFFRKMKEVAHMYLHSDYYGINDNLVKGYPKKNTKKGILIKLIYKIVRFFKSEKCISLYEKLQFISLANHKITNSYCNLLKLDKPNILFFTHQRPPFLSPLLYAANKLNIKTCSFIFSWDNLTSKGRMMGSFNSYLVWSELMKTELAHFYPLVDEKMIKIVGTPQFEPYILNNYKVDKASYYDKFGLDSSKKLICYSCADADIGANDIEHIKSIINFIRINDELNLQLLVRTSPAEDGVRFESLKRKFPEIKWNIPKWVLARDNHVEKWSQRIPTTEDVVELKSLLSFADVNVNMCSTMSLDFMLFDKPVINTVFGNGVNGLYDDQRFLNFIHYKNVIESKAVTIAKNEKELHKQLGEALHNPKLRIKYRKRLIKLQISKPLEGTSRRIAKIVLELSK